MFEKEAERCCVKRPGSEVGSDPPVTQQPLRPDVDSSGQREEKGPKGSEQGSVDLRSRIDYSVCSTGGRINVLVERRSFQTSTRVLIYHVVSG